MASICHYGLERPILQFKGCIGWWKRPTGSDRTLDHGVLSE